MFDVFQYIALKKNIIHIMFDVFKYEALNKY